MPKPNEGGNESGTVSKTQAAGQQAPRKKWAPKVRTGCITCRERRVKCDEGKPVCMRCTRAGFDCQGYMLPMPKSTALVSLSSVAPAGVQATLAELELHAFFQEQFAPIAFDEFTRDLWHVHVPQACRAEPPIWHACNAIAAVTRRRRIRQSPASADQLLFKSLTEAGFSQVSSSLKYITHLTSKPKLLPAEKSTIVAASFLLALWYGRMDDLDTADGMALSIIQLFQHWKLWNDERRGPIPSRYILYHLLKIDKRDVDSACLNENRPWHWKQALESFQRSKMKTPLDACLEIEMIWSGLQSLLNSMPLDLAQQTAVTAKRQTFVQYFEKYKIRFAEFQLQHPTDQERIRIEVIKIRRVLVEVALAADLTRMEECWDQFHETFQTTALQIEHLINMGTGTKLLPEVTAMLSKSLSWMAKVCREPILRRKLIELLRTRIEKIYIMFATKRSYHFPFTDILNSIMGREEDSWTRLAGGPSRGPGHVPSDGLEHEDECSSPGCSPRTFICNNHRVTEVTLNPDPTNPRDDLLRMRTVSDVLHDRPGRTQYVVALVWW